MSFFVWICPGFDEADPGLTGFYAHDIIICMFIEEGILMFSHKAIDDKYQNAAKEQGVRIQIEYRPGLSKAQEIEENDGLFTIKLSSDKISEADYAEYLSYNVRKVILPGLRLETERLLLRPFARSDAEACFPFLSDRDSAYMDDGTFFTAMDEEYERLMDAYAEQTRYMIIHKETGNVVGTVNLFDADRRAVDTKEIGYCISPESRRHGYAYEALSALLNYLLDDLSLDLVVAGIIPDNLPSVRLVEKLGFRCEGMRRKAFWNNMRGVVDLRYYYLEKN